MIKIHEDVFDKKWLDDISHTLMDQPWFANNRANRKTWPNGEKGSHLLMGTNYFFRENDNQIHYAKNENLSNHLIHSFQAIEKAVKRKMRLMEIFVNLQFKGMDGTLHKDGFVKSKTAFILMLANEHVSGDIGGEFFHQPTNTKIPYGYGKLIELDAEDLHMGLAFNKPNVARISIKYVGDNEN